MDKFKKYWSLGVGIILILYILILNIGWGTMSFQYPFVFCGIMFIMYYFLENHIKSNKFLNKLLKVVKVMMILGVIIFTIIEIRIITYTKSDTSKSDYMIILGAAIKGERLTMTLKQRLDKAIEYRKLYDENIKIIVSGGQGPGENITEAEAMKRYLIQNGIDRKNIIMENKSTNTMENLKFSRDKILEDSNKEMEDIKVKIVTSDFHSLRSNVLAKRNGYSSVTFYSNKTLPGLIPITYTRECFAIIKSYIFDR